MSTSPSYNIVVLRVYCLNVYTVTASVLDVLEAGGLSI